MTEVESALREAWRRLADIGAEVRRQAQRLTAVEQQSRLVGQAAGSGGSPPAALTPVWLPTGIGAGAAATPATKTDAILMVANATPPGFTTTGGTTATVYSTFTTAISGAKFAWFTTQADGNLYLSTGDC